MCDKCGCSEANTEQTLEEKVQDTIGACQGCPGAAMTMKMGIERILKEKIPEVKQVVAVD